MRVLAATQELCCMRTAGREYVAGKGRVVGLSATLMIFRPSKLHVERILKVRERRDTWKRLTGTLIHAQRESRLLQAVLPAVFLWSVHVYFFATPLNWFPADSSGDQLEAATEHG